MDPTRFTSLMTLTLLLAGATLPLAPAAVAHTCVEDDSCDPTGCEPGENHDHRQGNRSCESWDPHKDPPICRKYPSIPRLACEVIRLIEELVPSLESGLSPETPLARGA